MGLQTPTKHPALRLRGGRRTSCAPSKKPRGGKLTAEEKKGNKLISGIRVVVEHIIGGIKRCHIVKDVFRNTKADYDDTVMELACALHNFRSYQRRTAY